MEIHKLPIQFSADITQFPYKTKLCKCLIFISFTNGSFCKVPRILRFNINALNIHLPLVFIIYSVLQFTKQGVDVSDTHFV